MGKLKKVIKGSAIVISAIVMYVIISPYLMVDIMDVPPSTWRYEETADSYGCEGDWMVAYPCSNVYDGDWTTFGIYDVSNALVYINYTKPYGVLNSSLWQVLMGGAGRANLTIPSGCWNQNPLQYKGLSNSTDDNPYWYCYNGSVWVELKKTVAGQTFLYEEAMWWEYSKPVSLTNECGFLNNEYMYVINTSVVNSSGTCFTINSSGVTLNCDGSVINYSEKHSGYGIDNIGGYDNIDIKNCYVKGVNTSQSLSYGIYFIGVIESNISDCNITTRRFGIFLLSSSNNTFTNNIVHTTSSVGVYLSSSNDNIFKNTSITTGDNGIYIMSSSNNEFINSSVIIDGESAIYLRPGNGNKFINSVITAVDTAILVDGANDYTNYILNCSFDTSSVYFTSGSTDKLSIQWYLDVNVNNSDGNYLSGANVSAVNVDNVEIFKVQTNTVGDIVTQNVTQYIQNISGIYSKNNYTINVTYGGHVSAKGRYYSTGDYSESMCLWNGTNWTEDVTYFEFYCILGETDCSEYYQNSTYPAIRIKDNSSTVTYIEGIYNVNIPDNTLLTSTLLNSSYNLSDVSLSINQTMFEGFTLYCNTSENGIVLNVSNQTVCYDVYVNQSCDIWCYMNVSTYINMTAYENWTFDIIGAVKPMT